jgi:hypothetical protein
MSANTAPLPISSVLLLILSLLGDPFRLPHAPADQVDFGLRRFTPRFRFLPEGVQHVNGAAHGHHFSLDITT